MSQSRQLLVVGVGSIGERHLRCFQNTGRCQIAICEINDELRNAVCERYRDIYYADRNQGGGGIQDAMTHLYNLGEWLLGPIDRVVTDAAHQYLPGVEVEDTVHTLARHGNVLASYTMNQYQAPNELTYTIVCERGTLCAAYARRQWSWMTEPDVTWQHERVETPHDHDATYLKQAQVFLDALQRQARPLCPLDEGIQTLRVNLASLRSCAEQSWQMVRS